MLNQISLKLVANCVENYFRINFQKNPVLKPIVFAYYITSMCNFNCSFCNLMIKGELNAKKSQLNTAEAIDLLKIIRKTCPNLYITGGEPLLREDIVEILKAAKILRFKSISMVSNMSLIHKKMEVLDYLSNLTVSLDTINDEKYSRIMGVTRAVSKKVMENIIMCAKLQKEKGFVLRVNFVINEDTLPGANEVIDFCFKENIAITVGPEILCDGTVDPKLKSNRSYKQFIEHLLELKKSNKLIFDTKSYLKTLLNFNRFNCYPLVTPRVDAMGNFSYPCIPAKKMSLNLLKIGSYEKALEIAMQQHSSMPQCKDKCFMNCYIEPSFLAEAPLRTLFEFI